MTLKNHINEFKDYLASKGRSLATIVAYNRDLEQLIDFLKNFNHSGSSADLTAQQLKEFVDFLIKDDRFSLKTVSRKINSLKTFSKFLYEKKYTKTDVAESLAHPKFELKKPRVLTPIEYRALRDASRGNVRLYTMVELLLQTGIRIGELSRLKRVDLFINKQELNISGFSSKPQRIVKLNDRVIESFEYYFLKFPEIKSAKSKATPLFQTKNGKEILIRNIRSTIDRAFINAGIKNASVNDIRNTFIIHQLESGIDINFLAKMVGHHKSSTTENYLPLVNNRPQKTILKITPL